MLSWQKRARTALALLMLAVALAVILAIVARRGREDPPPPPKRTDQTATLEAGRGEFTRTKDGRTIFILTFERQLTYADGRNVLSGVAITFPNRSGRTFRVTGREARQLPGQGKELGAIALDGGVEMTGDDGLIIRTDGASYDETAGVVRAPGPVTFSRGRVGGSGVGATYDQARDVVTLLKQARVTIAPDAAGPGGMTITADTATVARADRTVLFERNVTVTGSPQSAAADRITAYLAPKEDVLDRAELTGRASVTGAAGEATALRAMKGETIVLDYGPDGRTVERATLKGSASVDLAAAGGTRALSGNTIDATLAADGGTVAALSAAGKVELTLPAEGNAPARTIQSSTLQGRGDASGLRTLTFGGGVTFKEAAARTATSDSLEVRLKPGFGAAEEARFTGRVVFRDGTVRAESPDAQYAIERGVIRMAPAGPAMPRVSDERVSVDARAIDLTAGSKRLVAKGDVRSLVQPHGPDAKARRTPAILEGDKPANVTAAELDYDGETGRATYTGNARLWQGETSVQGDTLILDDTQGNLVVKGNARSRLLLEEKKNEKDTEKGRDPAAKKTETLARGDTLTYDDAARKAVYDGHAHFSGPQGEVDADRIELFLDDTGRTLERAEGYTAVVARFEGGHRATGARLTYVADGERYLMNGAPVRILEKVSDGCRETTGASLTFVRSTDTIAVVGNEGSRSRTTPGSCAELR